MSKYTISDLVLLFHDCGDWTTIFNKILNERRVLCERIIGLYNSTSKIYPAFNDLLKPFKLCPFYSLKCVFIGDSSLCDHEKNNLLFSKKPRNKALEQELIFETTSPNRQKGYKTFLDNPAKLARQGVLMLPTSLTSSKGDRLTEIELWTDFIKTVLAEIHEIGYVVYMFWDHSGDILEFVTGLQTISEADKKLEKYKRKIKTTILLSANTSGRGLRFSNIFITANHYIKSWEQAPIKWIYD